MSYSRPPETRTCTDCPRKFRVAGGDSKSTKCVRCRFHEHRNGWGRTRIKKYQHSVASDALIRSRYDGKVKGRAAEIARQLGWPTWAVKKQAARLGLCYPLDRKDWTPEEVKFLEEWRGARPVDWIARKLGRTLTSTVLKFKRLGISPRVHQGYTLRMLGQCFGVDHKTIEPWVQKGLLRMEYGIPAAGSRRWKVSETAIFEFIWNNPAAFRMDKVDQPWFMDLMRRSMQVAIAAARQKGQMREDTVRIRPVAAAGLTS